MDPLQKIYHGAIYYFGIFVSCKTRRSEGAKSEADLAVVVRKQESLFVPVDGVVRVADHPAVYESVSSSHRSDVLHGPDPGRTWLGRW